MGEGETTVAFERRCRHCGSPLSIASSFCSKCGATAVSPVAGDDPMLEKLRALFGADLEFERELGRGGMGAVFAAFDPALQRRVAVKVLLPEMADEPSAADRFIREARTVAALQHPHVVAVYAVRSADDVHAIVMQFVEGRSLDAILTERGRIAVPLAGLVLAQAAAGLQHAHERGVIHRDVKPANVLIDKDGRAIVSDFGIARRDSMPRITETGMVFGTWAYMSPEQRTADELTPATDQYALGVMAFELLTGQLPFRGTAAEMLRAHLHTPAPSLRAIVPDIPVAVENAVLRMLAKAPEDRWPSLRDVERLFTTLTKDQAQTTIQLAGISRVQGATSVVMAAVPKPAAKASPSAVTARVVPDATVPIAATMATASVPRMTMRAMSIVGGTIAVVLSGIVYLTTHQLDGSARPAVSATAPGVADAGAPPTTLPPSGGARGVAEKSAPVSGDRSATVAPIAGGANLAPAPLTSAPTTQPVAPVASPASEPTKTDSRVDRAAAPAPTAAEAKPAATLADARRLGRDFVTLINQRRYRELAAIPAIGGAAAERAELLRLTEKGTDLAAGFDRVPSAPSEWTNGFETEFFVDLEWRGGKKLIRVTLYASQVDGVWKAVGVAVDPAG